MRINRALGRYELNRSHSGDTGFEPDFASIATAPISSDCDEFRIHAFVDRSSIELFINDGQTVMTALLFPSAPLTRIALAAHSHVGLLDAQIFELQSIWGNR